MSASVASVANRLIGWEAERSKVKRAVARGIVARKAGVSASSLERAQSGRLKFVDRIAGKLNDLLVNAIEGQIVALEHELAILRAKAGDAREADIVGAEAALAQARACLGRE